MEQQGWIKIYRQIFYSDIWTDSEPFDRRSAWIDLIMLANHSDNKIILDNQIVVIKKGQLVTSIRKLAERWHWGNTKTVNFLKLLESDGMIAKTQDTRKTVLTIVNYGKFQCEDENTRHSQDTDKTLTRHSQDTDKTLTRRNKNEKNDKELENDKELKNEKNIYIITDSNESVCQTEVRQVIDAWNELETVGIKPVSRLVKTSKRYKCLIARLKEYNLADVLLAIDKIRESSFLTGHNPKGWTITFDWFVLPSNFPKVLEGQYDNRVQYGLSEHPKGMTDVERIFNS